MTLPTGSLVASVSGGAACRASAVTGQASAAHSASATIVDLLGIDNASPFEPFVTATGSKLVRPTIFTVSTSRPRPRRHNEHARSIRPPQQCAGPPWVALLRHRDRAPVPV